MKNVVFFTGSGISAESGIQTFREAGTGLWENFRIEDVCTHEAMLFNRDVVIDFYNHLRQQLLTKQPNAAHYAIAELQKKDPEHVHIVTQNVDDLHERAGATNVVHLHGELMKLRGTNNENDAISIAERPDLFEDGWAQRKDDRYADGSLLRPFIVFFGESVPKMTEAIALVEQADVLVVIGTSLAVYPAASLLYYAKRAQQIICIDPGEPELGEYRHKVSLIQKKASEGVVEVCKNLAE